MAKHLVKKGATSRIEYVWISDSASAVGAGKTGLAFNTASLTAYYCRRAAAATSITLATQTVTGAFSSGGFVEVDATNMPGLYRFDPPDAAFATAVDKVTFLLKGAAGMAPVVLEYQLVDFDPEDAASMGLTKFADIEADTQDIQGRLPAALVSGRIDASVGAMAANVLTAAAINTDAITAAKVAADVTTELQAGLATAAAVATLQTGVDDLPTNAELATAFGTADDAVLAQVALVKAKTDNLPGDPADASDIATAFAGIDTSLGALTTAIGGVPTALENADVLLDRDLSAGIDSGSPTVRTVRQALRFLRNKWALASGTLTVYKEDDTAASWTGAVTTAPGADPISGSDPA